MFGSDTVFYCDFYPYLFKKVLLRHAFPTSKICRVALISLMPLVEKKTKTIIKIYKFYSPICLPTVVKEAQVKLSESFEHIVFEVTASNNL